MKTNLQSYYRILIKITRFWNEDPAGCITLFFDKYMHSKSHSLKRLFRLFSAGDNFKQFLKIGILKLKKDQLFNIGFNLLVFALLRASLYRIKNIVCLKDRRLNHILSAYCKK